MYGVISVGSTLVLEEFMSSHNVFSPKIVIAVLLFTVVIFLQNQLLGSYILPHSVHDFIFLSNVYFTLRMFIPKTMVREKHEHRIGCLSLIRLLGRVHGRATVHRSHVYKVSRTGSLYTYHLYVYRALSALSKTKGWTRKNRWCSLGWKYRSPNARSYLRIPSWDQLVLLVS